MVCLLRGDTYSAGALLVINFALSQGYLFGIRGGYSTQGGIAESNGSVMLGVWDAGKKGGRREQKGTYYLKPTNISQKFRASEALFGEYPGLCLSQSYE